MEKVRGWGGRDEGEQMGRAEDGGSSEFWGGVGGWVGGLGF